MCRYDAEGHGLGTLPVQGEWLDLMFLKGLSNQNDSVIHFVKIVKCLTVPKCAIAVFPTASHPCKIKAEIITWNATRNGDVPVVYPFQHATGHARLVLLPLPASLADMAWCWTMTGTAWHLDTARTLSTTWRKLRPASLVIRNASAAQDLLNTSVLAVQITTTFSVSVLVLPPDFIVHWKHE